MEQFAYLPSTGVALVRLAFPQSSGRQTNIKPVEQSKQYIALIHIILVQYGRSSFHLSYFLGSTHFTPSSLYLRRSSLKALARQTWHRWIAPISESIESCFAQTSPWRNSRVSYCPSSETAPSSPLSQIGSFFFARNQVLARPSYLPSNLYSSTITSCNQFQCQTSLRPHQYAALFPSKSIHFARIHQNSQSSICLSVRLMKPLPDRGGLLTWSDNVNSYCIWMPEKANGTLFSFTTLDSLSPSFLLSFGEVGP